MRVKLFGKDEDGIYNGLIEQIETSRKYDILDISNRHPNWWIFSIFNGYRQVGQFKIDKPHDFKEGDLLKVVKKDTKIINVEKDSITISNIKEVFGGIKNGRRS